MKPTTSALRSLLDRPAAEWKLLIEATVRLLWTRLQIASTPFARIASELGISQAETLQRVSELQRLAASKISWALLTISRYSPLSLVCLPQAMAATIILRKRGIHPQKRAIR